MLVFVQWKFYRYSDTPLLPSLLWAAKITEVCNVETIKEHSIHKCTEQKSIISIMKAITKHISDTVDYAQYIQLVFFTQS